jgi:hypothetical protein
MKAVKTHQANIIPNQMARKYLYDIYFRRSPPKCGRELLFLTRNTMKLILLLSTLAVAAGFAPGFVGRQASPLFADLKSGTVKW